jgi:hypothetical protein
MPKQLRTQFYYYLKSKKKIVLQTIKNIHIDTSD